MAAASTAASEVSDGPVLSLINKRLRALRKKLNRITQMEEAIANGKPIKKEQEEVLRSKTAVVALIDELEKLRPPLSEAIAEEISLISGTAAEPKTDSAPAEPEAVEDLMSLLYFGSLFDVKPQSDFTATMLTRTHERGCCLTYDYVTDDATDPLREADLDSISRLGGLLVSRPADSILSHKDALLKCIEHAKLWLASSKELVDPSADITYSGLRERLGKIIASDYMTTTPEMKAPVEVAAAFQVPSEAPVPDPVQVESSAPQFQQDKATTEFEEHKQIENQSSAVEEFHQEERKPNAEYQPAEPVAAEQEQTQPEVEFESKDWQHDSRRSYQNQRGGGSGGQVFSVGGRRGARGNTRGRPYQNGGYHQDQQQGGGGGRYYPRNNNYYNTSNRGGGGGGGGGRGGRGGGPAYNNNDGFASVGVGS